MDAISFILENGDFRGELLHSFLSALFRFLFMMFLYPHSAFFCLKIKKQKELSRRGKTSP